jgi:PAS domain S-box-containing protein
MTVPETSANTYMADGRQLGRWKAISDALPPGTDVRYQEPGFWQVYRWYVVGLVSFFLLEGLLIFGLLVQRANRRRAVERFRHMFEGAPVGMIMVAEDGRIVLANAQMDKLFGYSKEQLFGLPVDELVSEHSRGRLPAHRQEYFAAPRVRAMGAECGLRGRRRDGTEFPLEIGLGPVQTEAGRFVLVSVVDITERKLAEDGLREGQRELRELTGKLIHAQESERRRIARELHDDLSQTLALMSVELDLLAQKSPEGPELRNEVRKLTSHVKSLSTSVHELSHQIHPLKLEQLGLVAAVHALCKELSHTYGLKIDFAASQVPDHVAPEVALCLYRIVQEGLRNAIKHSGTDRIQVQLSGNAPDICLQIVDDGVGFEPGSVDGRSGLGLVGMRERLRLVGGAIVLDSSPGHGTRIDVRVPAGARPDEDGSSGSEQTDATTSPVTAGRPS